MSVILIVEDDPAIARLLRDLLAGDGHDVRASATSADALHMLGGGGIDAALVDLGLPDMDGRDLIARIRHHYALPIIVVTARNAVTDKIEALDLGADDYVTKPFDGDELRARLRSALRRGAGERVDDSLSFGPITLDVARHMAWCNGVEVSLTPKEYAMLQVMVGAGGRVLTHRLLLEQVWGKAHVDDIDYLRVAIRALRLKLEEDPAQPRLIRNEPGIGYRLVAPS